MVAEFMLIAMALATGAAQTGATAAAPTTASATADTSATKPICRRYADVGSNIPRRKVCMSKQQWDKMARDSQDLARSMQPALTSQGQ